jgi:hypothetical protein
MTISQASLCFPFSTKRIVKKLTTAGQFANTTTFLLADLYVEY